MYISAILQFIQNERRLIKNGMRRIALHYQRQNLNWEYKLHNDVNGNIFPEL